MKNKVFILKLMGVLFFAILTYNNCAPEHKSSSSSSLSTGVWSCADQLDNLSLFSKTYHSFLMNKCSSCHSGGGPGPGAFASSGVQLALNSFTSLGFSRINTKATDGHSPSSGQQNIAETNTLTNLWVDGLQTIERCRQSGAGELTQVQDDTSRLQLISRAINPNVNGPVTLTWNLQTDVRPTAGYNAADFANVRLSATVEIFQRPGVFAYVISNPILSTTSSDIHLESLLFKINGVASPAQRAFYFVNKDVRAWNASNPDFNKPDPNPSTPYNDYRYTNELISGGAMVLLGEVRTTDVLSISIGRLQRVVLPPPEQFPNISFGVSTMSVDENYSIINIPITLSKPWSSPASAEIVFGSDTTIKDQCCRSAINDVGDPITVSHFDRDIQDYDTDPKFPINNRLQYEMGNIRGRYLVTFAIGETSKTLRIKIVHDNKFELNEVLHLRVDSSRLVNLNPGATLQDFRLTILDNDLPYIGTAPTYTNLLSDGGILANECLRCHNSVLNRGGYDITNYEQMVSKAILRPGDATNSIMFLRMDADNIPGLDPMPLTGLIDPLQRFDVKQWILQGARNN